MTVTPNKDEILQRANGLMREFADAHYEMGEAQNFIRGLCDVLGCSNKRMVSFEQRVKKLGGKRGRIDGFYPGKLLVEMKSKGEDLDEAFKQAIQHLPGLAELSTYCLVSDFKSSTKPWTPPTPTPAPLEDAGRVAFLFALDTAPTISDGMPLVINSPERTKCGANWGVLHGQQVTHSLIQEAQ